MSLYPIRLQVRANSLSQRLLQDVQIPHYTRTKDWRSRLDVKGLARGVIAKSVLVIPGSKSMATKKRIGQKKTKTALPKKKIRQAKASALRRVDTGLDFSSLEAFKQSIRAFGEALTGKPLANDMIEEEGQAEWKEIRRGLKSQRSRKRCKVKK